MDTIKPNFLNTSKRVAAEKNNYGFDNVPPLLAPWSRFLQAVLSQGVTKLLVGVFHDKSPKIYNIIGGIKVQGKGELKLFHDDCEFEQRWWESDSHRAAILITEVVLGWDPFEPVNSVLKKTADYISCSVTDLRLALDASDKNKPFGGNDLIDFFSRCKMPSHELREYRSYCYVKFNNWTPEKVKEKWQNEDLAEWYEDELNAKLEKQFGPDQRRIYSVTPQYFKFGTRFLVDTGRKTNLDGWKTKEELDKFVKGLPVLDLV